MLEEEVAALEEVDEFADMPDEMGDIDKMLELDRQVSERLDALGSSLQQKADEVVNQRRAIEANWLEDIAQYNGKYSDSEVTRLKSSGGSQLFANITRPKVNAAEARISDILFPTDDRNWDIRPTPVPDGRYADV